VFGIGAEDAVVQELVGARPGDERSEPAEEFDGSGRVLLSQQLYSVSLRDLRR